MPDSCAGASSAVEPRPSVGAGRVSVDAPTSSRSSGPAPLSSSGSEWRMVIVVSLAPALHLSENNVEQQGARLKLRALLRRVASESQRQIRGRAPGRQG